MNFWSERFVDQGFEGYDPVKVTTARPFEVREPCAVTSIKTESKARLMREPEYGKTNPSATSVLHYRKPDSLASIVSSFEPKLPAPRNAEIITTPVRYHLDTTLVKAFEPDQVQEYKAQLIAEGRWRLPNNGDRHTIRFNYWDVSEVFGLNDQLRVDWNGPRDRARAKAEGLEFFIDFDMDGETMTRATGVVRGHLPGLSLEQKKLLAENPGRVRASDGRVIYDCSKASAWWETKGWLVHRCDYDGSWFEVHAELARALLDVLVISLMDRSVVRIATDRPAPSKKWEASGLAHPEQEVQEITIYCPGRVTGGDGAGSHASPRMHWRRGHNRTLTKGRDMPLVVPIAPVWVNADEESEKVIPLRSYKLKTAAG